MHRFNSIASSSLRNTVAVTWPRAISLPYKEQTSNQSQTTTFSSNSLENLTCLFWQFLWLSLFFPQEKRCESLQFRMVRFESYSGLQNWEERAQEMAFHKLSAYNKLTTVVIHFCPLTGYTWRHKKMTCDLIISAPLGKQSAGSEEESLRLPHICKACHIVLTPLCCLNRSAFASQQRWRHNSRTPVTPKIQFSTC